MITLLRTKKCEWGTIFPCKKCNKALYFKIQEVGNLLAKG